MEGGIYNVDNRVYLIRSSYTYLPLVLRGNGMISDTLCAAIATIVCIGMSIHAFYTLPSIVGIVYSLVALLGAYTTYRMWRG